MTLVAVIHPRLDLGDTHRNRVQAHALAAMGPGIEPVTGLDPVVDAPWWSMSRALNHGRTQTTSPYLLLTPADYLIPPEVIARTREVLNAWPWWNPFHSVRQVPRTDTLGILRGRPDRGRGEVWPLCIAAVAVRAEVFDDVGGMDERFQGWGPEDAALRTKLRILHGEPPPPEFQAAELWCPRPAPVNADANCSMYAAEYMTAATPADVRRIIDRRT